MVVDTNKEIRRAVDTGKVSFGYKEAKKKLLAGEGEMVIVSANMPKNERETIKQIANIESKKFFEYPANGMVLGSVCGKPFVISTMLILEEGKSKVLEIQ
ncbi:MAG: 50S ribosomal protein L30e [archaeon]|jgi:large subunit ribosomal protein L30e